MNEVKEQTSPGAGSTEQAEAMRVENEADQVSSAVPAGSQAASDTVAVVVVHGVADQEPGESVRSIGRLLLRLRRSGAAIYRGFREIALHIPLQPVRLPTGTSPDTRTPAATPELLRRGTNERPEYVLEQLSRGGDGTSLRPSTPQATPSPPPDPPPHHRFSRVLVEHYPGSCGSYATVRLEGERTDGQKVHLHELYWADLSRVGRGLVGILGAFYQLVFHLPNLGRLAIDHALFEHPGSRAWRLFAHLHVWAVRLLTLFLPIIALLMVMTLLAVLPGALSPSWKLVVGLGGLSLAAIVGSGRILYREPKPFRLSRWRWALLPVVLVLAALGVGWLLLAPLGEDSPFLTYDQLAVLVWIAVAAAGAIWLFDVYERQRPGVKRWGAALLMALLVVPSLCVAGLGNTREEIASLVLWVYELQSNCLGIVAVAFYLLALTSAMCGVYVILRSSARRRTARVVWTALASLALSTAGLFLATLMLGIGIFFTGRTLLPDVPHEPLLTWTTNFFLAAGVEANPAQPKALELLLRLGATSGLAILVAGTALLILGAGWGLGPAVLSEVLPPKEERAADPSRSEALGHWLDLAFSALGALVLCLFVSVFVLSPTASVLRILAVERGEALTSWTKILWDWSGSLLVGTGALIGASAVGFLALRGRLERLALGFRPVLDVALDVDSYLRDLPREDTPRARMFERYVSLLRYLSSWRDAAGRNYRSIVIVAHSQGTVLTADLLDFLQREHDPELPWTMKGPTPQAPQIKLFTMGSPLRQLYAACFPHLYWWIAGEPWVSPPVATPRPPTSPTAAWDHVVGHALTGDPAPDPGQLGVSQWVNAYRSGDYVGRMLWRNAKTCPHIFRTTAEDADSKVRYTVSEDSSRHRRELCLGAGAHTHYWDETAPAIAEELDLLIG